MEKEKTSLPRLLYDEFFKLCDEYEANPILVDELHPEDKLQIKRLQYSINKPARKNRDCSKFKLNNN